MLSTFHFLIILSIISYLIYVNLNPQDYDGITNSSILNYGIWLQCEFSIILGIYNRILKFKL